MVLSINRFIDCSNRASKDNGKSRLLFLTKFIIEWIWFRIKFWKRSVEIKGV
jgi:hypothetical protein